MRWPSTATAIVEVKAFHASNAVRAAERVVERTYVALMAHAEVLRGFCGKIMWDDDAILSAPPNETAIADAVGVALQRMRTMGDTPTKEAVCIPGIGTLHLVPVLSLSAFDLKMDGFTPTDGAIYRRLERRAIEGLEQLKETHPELPGILMLDVDEDGLARNCRELLAGWTSNQEQLGAVLALEREYGEGYAYGNVLLFEGPRFEEVADINTALEVCDLGHLHYQPISMLGRPCGAGFGLAV